MSRSTNDDWQQVQRIFAAAVELSPERRLAFVRDECAGDERLFREVATLVEEFDTAVDEFESPLKVAFDEPDVNVVRPDIEGYQIHEELHRGGQGVVCRATQLATKRNVAIKFMLSGPFASESARRRFQREVELASQLRHSGIVGVFDGGVASGQPWFVMEYVDGEQLQNYVAEQQLNLFEKLGLMAKICEAVGAAHANGVIHRDLKPSNVMVTRQGEPRVLDFGLAKSATPDERLSLTGQVMGTVAYMSPEQAGGRELTLASDVYSLSVMLYELFCGRLPQQLSGPVAQKLQTIQSGNYTPVTRYVSTIDRAVDAIISKGLRLQPDQRYPTATAMADDINRYLRGEAVQARGPSVGDRIWTLLRRNSVRVALTAAVLAGFTAGVWGVGMFAGDPPIAGPLPPLIAGRYYGENELESQILAMNDLMDRDAQDTEVLQEFDVRFNALRPDMFQGLTQERRADLNILLSTLRLVSDEPSAGQMAAMQQRLLAPGPEFSGMARDVSLGVIAAAESVGWGERKED